jgi:hypothetical protein
MKKIMVPLAGCLVAISLCTLTLATANAEEPQRKATVLRIGGVVGGGLVDWLGKDANGSLPGAERAAKPGFAAGLLANIDLSRVLGIEQLRLSIQPELTYALKGSRLLIEGDYRARTNMTYLQTGLLFRAEYAMAARAAPYVILGPELGLLRSVEFRNRSGETSNTRDDYESTDLGLILGVGAMYSLPPVGSLGLEVRADLGLVSIDGQGDGDEIRNAALSLLLVYLY